LVFALAASVKALDPVWTTAGVTWELSRHLYEFPLRLDPQGALHNNMFDTWDISDDQLNWTFTLRDDMTFEDGDKITTDDFIASTFRWAERINGGIALFQRSIDGNSSAKSLEKVDDLTFIVHLKEPFAVTSLGFGQEPFMMKEEIAGATSPHDRVDEFVTSGPWRLANWAPGFRFDLEPREGFPAGIFPEGERVFLDALQIVEIPDKTTLLAGLKTGKIHYGTFMPRHFWPDVKDDPKLTTWVYPAGNSPVVLFNHTKLPFSNLKARQAMQAALDADEWMPAYGPQELWSTCGAIFICGTPNESDASLELYDQGDLPKAQQLFQEFVQETGWDPDTPIIILGNTSYVEMRDISIVNQATARAVGFNANLQQPDWATAVTFRQDPEYWDMFHTSCCGVPSNNPVLNWYLSPKTYGWHDNLEIEDLKSQYSRASDPAEQKRIVDAVQTSYYENVTHMIPGNSIGYNIINANVQGVHDYHNNTRMTGVWFDN
jgi:peptide/nickel transport system substrate-binding protein